MSQYPSRFLFKKYTEIRPQELAGLRYEAPGVTVYLGDGVSVGLTFPARMAAAFSNRIRHLCNARPDGTFFECTIPVGISEKALKTFRAWMVKCCSNIQRLDKDPNEGMPSPYHLHPEQNVFFQFWWLISEFIVHEPTPEAEMQRMLDNRILREMGNSQMDGSRVLGQLRRQTYWRSCYDKRGRFQRNFWYTATQYFHDQDQPSRDQLGGFLKMEPDEDILKDVLAKYALQTYRGDGRALDSSAIPEWAKDRIKRVWQEQV